MAHPLAASAFGPDYSATVTTTYQAGAADKPSEPSATHISAEAAGSFGALHPSVLAADAARRAAVERPSAHEVLIGTKWRAHEAVAARQASFFERPCDTSRIAYVQYLRGLHRTFTLLTAHPLPPQLATLNKLVDGRIAAIDHDIEKLGVVGASYSPLMDKHKHMEHFASVAAKPHCLAAHYAVHSAGFLFGGQIVAGMMKRIG